MDINTELNYMSLTLGLASLGFAKAESYREAPLGHRPEDILPGAKSVVTFSYRMNKGAINHLPGTRNQYMQEFTAVNAILLANVHKITRFLEEKGFESIGIGPEADIGDYARLRGDFSHKHSAVLCGLGCFGINNLLLTPRYGARVRLASVITTAELKPAEPKPAEPAREDYCTGCLACVQACPSGALSRWEGSYSPLRGWVIDKEKCAHYIFATCQGKRCGLCVQACPGT